MLLLSHEGKHVNPIRIPYKKQQDVNAEAYLYSEVGNQAAWQKDTPVKHTVKPEQLRHAKQNIKG